MSSRTNNDVIFVSDPKKYHQSELPYLEVRTKENRVLADEQVIKLPDTPSQYDHHREWNLRKKSLRRLKKLIMMVQPKAILDVGCGNGWLIGNLSKQLSGCSFAGIDLNREELTQASRLFGSDFVKFYYIDLIADSFFEDEAYDVIIFNASIQYFRDLSSIISTVSQLLKKNGMIIINDSPFYANHAAAEQAAIRSKEYYENLNVPAMSSNYFHHTVGQLAELGFTRQNSWISRLMRYPFQLYTYSKNI